MRSTVSDSSGNPENGENPENRENSEHGEETYGALPVREWAVPDRPGRAADASAHADGVRGPDPVTGPDDWSAPGEGSGSGSGRDQAHGTGAVARSGPDSVVDLVLDLMPGESGRGGSAFGATSASVSVPGAAPEPVPAADAVAVEAAEDARPEGATASVPAPGATVLAPQAQAQPQAWTRIATIASAPDADPAAGPHMREDAREDAREGDREDGLDAVRDPGQPALADNPFLPGPGLAPVRRDTGPSPSLSFGGADTGEPQTAVRVETGRHHSVIASERAASIPVHLLFRDDPEAVADTVALPATIVRRAAGSEQAAGVRRPPVPQVWPSTRPAPVADPRLRERPGPALPGWAALLTGLGGLAATGGVLWWTGALPGGVLSRLGLGPRPYDGIGLGAWVALALLLTTVLFALGGLTRGRVGYAWVLTIFGQYRGSVRRTGLMWVSPLLLRRRVDVRLRHWRSEPLPAVDANGTALRVVVLVVWRVEDTVRATLGIADHEEYLRAQVEAAMARVLSQLPADAFHEDAHTLRNAEAVGDALTRMLKADCEPVGIEVYSAQPTGIEYAPEVAAAMQRRRIAAIDAKHRDSVLTSVVDAVDDTVNRLTARGLVELDDYERKSLVKDLTVAFYTGRGGGDSA
ncbi:SPFH domain-containing protein [Streptomyces laculatispora]|uniref:SPFH domain-containing protein n=1 Tax=Streptomyces laculatispora TaxID=887464 RepID=A0ABY9I7T8_9ACTN|nr:SPFH domain-containing protein [Streptomyces laculatispora]WLQ42933.1 SPFH domain-containing protein [Streptomyces laculatispora]